MHHLLSQRDVSENPLPYHLSFQIPAFPFTKLPFERPLPWKGIDYIVESPLIEHRPGRAVSKSETPEFFSLRSQRACGSAVPKRIS